MTTEKTNKRFSSEDRLRIIRSHMEEHDGACHPETFVEEAASTNHPAHEYFEWDNSAAGHQYRVWQARQFMQIRIRREATEVIDMSDGQTTIQIRPMPALVSPVGTRSTGGGYIATDTEEGELELRREARLMFSQWISRFGAVLSNGETKTANRLAKQLS